MNVFRVEQQRPAGTEFDRAIKDQAVVAREFSKAATAGGRKGACVEQAAGNGVELVLGNHMNNAAVNAGSQQLRAGGKGNVLGAQYVDAPARGLGAAGIQRAAVDHTAAHAFKHDLAIDIANAHRTHQSGVVDGRCGEVRNPRREHGPAAVGQHLPAVTHSRRTGECCARNLDADQAIASQIERHARAREERSSALGGTDYAGVVHHFGSQHHKAAVGRANHALIDDAGALSGIGQHVAAGHEIGVSNIRGARKQAANIHRRSFSKQDAMRIDEEDAAIGREVAKNLAGRAANHPIQDDSRRRRLDELHEFVIADIELLPVDGRRRRGLVDDRADGIGRANAGRTRHDFAAGRIGQRQCRQQGWQRKHKAAAAKADGEKIQFRQAFHWGNSSIQQCNWSPQKSARGLTWLFKN